MRFSRFFLVIGFSVLVACSPKLKNIAATQDLKVHGKKFEVGMALIENAMPGAEARLPYFTLRLYPPQRKFSPHFIKATKLMLFDGGEMVIKRKDWERPSLESLNGSTYDNVIRDLKVSSGVYYTAVVYLVDEMGITYRVKQKVSVGKVY